MGAGADLRTKRKTLEAVRNLPLGWTGAGTVTDGALDALFSHLSSRDIQHSVETGTGRSTLIFSHFSEDHTVFALDGGSGSIEGVKTSEHFSAEGVTFVEGPSQETMRSHPFGDLNVAMLDGPHGYPFPELEYYRVYPHLVEGSLLIVDDIQIPTISNLFRFLKEEDMFRLIEVEGRTAFFERTSAPTFDPFGDGWWRQKYNIKRAPVAYSSKEWLDKELSKARRRTPAWIKNAIPAPLRERFKGRTVR